MESNSESGMCSINALELTATQQDNQKYTSQNIKKHINILGIDISNPAAKTTINRPYGQTVNLTCLAHPIGAWWIGSTGYLGEVAHL